jgi:hypothetical protein
MGIASYVLGRIVKTLRNIVAVGLMIGIGALATTASDDSSSSSGDSSIRTAISIFQDQRADYFRRQREQERSCSGKLREEARDQVAAAKITNASLRREMKISIAEAKAHALEQSRKLVEEGSGASRQSRHGQ